MRFLVKFWWIKTVCRESPRLVMSVAGLSAIYVRRRQGSKAPPLKFTSVNSSNIEIREFIPESVQRVLTTIKRKGS